MNHHGSWARGVVSKWQEQTFWSQARHELVNQASIKLFLQIHVAQKKASTTGEMLTIIETFAEPHFEIAERSCSRNYILILKELNLKESVR